MGDVIDLEVNKAHVTREIVCLRCLHRWIAVYPEKTLLKDLECPSCKEQSSCIGTGQDIGNDKGN